MARARAVIAAAWWGVLLCGCGDDAAAADAGAVPAIDGSTADAGPELRATTPTGAARDLGALIDATRGAADRVFVHGGSYGTYWAQRYLQLFPISRTPSSSTVWSSRPSPPTGWDTTRTTTGSAAICLHSAIGTRTARRT
ncbi:MAG: hypothetical protein IT379_41830 [Deltaproteobacteria bacterium]|nr:hypothetical protein [Deltaproteobacteria bacterium]